MNNTDDMRMPTPENVLQEVVRSVMQMLPKGDRPSFHVVLSIITYALAMKDIAIAEMSSLAAAKYICGRETRGENDAQDGQGHGPHPADPSVN